jgi:hypothetical protein
MGYWGQVMYTMVTAQFADSISRFQDTATGDVVQTFTPKKQDSSTCWIKASMDPTTGLDTVTDRVI